LRISLGVIVVCAIVTLFNFTVTVFMVSTSLILLNYIDILVYVAILIQFCDDSIVEDMN
jgi:hypothetical protein